MQKIFVKKDCYQEIFDISQQGNYWTHAYSASVGISVCCSDLVSGIFTFPEKENIT